MPTRRSLLGLVAALPAATVPPAVRLGSHNNLRLNPDIVGMVVDVCVVAELFLYISLSKGLGAVSGLPIGYQVLRWNMNSNCPPDLVQGMRDGQQQPWKLTPLPDGGCLAYTEDGCFAILG